MQITREINGVESIIELTANELCEAYRIKKREYYLEDIENALLSINDGEDTVIHIDAVLADIDLCSTIIRHYENYLYEGDGDRWYDIALADIRNTRYFEQL